MQIHIHQLSSVSLFNKFSFQISSRRSRINEDSGMQHYYNTSNIMNYKGDSLDVTDITGAGAGSIIEPIVKHRKIPLNPLNPDYEFPGDVELKGTQSRRQLHGINQNLYTNSRETRSRTKSQRRLLQSIRNSRRIDQMIGREPSVIPEDEFSHFNTRHRSVAVDDRRDDSFDEASHRKFNLENNPKYQLFDNNQYSYDMNEFILKRKNEIRMSDK